MASSNENGGEEDSDALSSEKQESLLNDGVGVTVAAVNEAEDKVNVEDVLPRLEEEVALQQLSLQSLSNKRRLLELQIEVERSKRRKHIVTLQSLQKRKSQLETSRKTHLNLWREVKRTLEKCQERHKRMAPSTDLEELDGSGSIAEEGSEGLGKQEDPHTKDVVTLKETTRSRDAPEEPAPLERMTSLIPVPLLHVDRNTLRDFWSSSTTKNNYGIPIFFPFIDSSATLQKIMKVMALEILTLDTKYPNSSRHRAQSVLGTCLDVSSYRSKAVSRAIQGRLIHKGDDTLEERGSTNDEATIVQIDPDVVLCPYELSGVCADVHCPYQHTTARSGVPGGGLMMPRELLPLPQLRLPSSPVPFDEYTEKDTSKSGDVATPTDLPRSQKDDVLSNKKVSEDVISNDAKGSTEIVAAVDIGSDEESKESAHNEQLEHSTSDKEVIKDVDMNAIDWGSNPDFIGLPTLSMDVKTASQMESTDANDEIPPWAKFWWSEEKDVDRAKVLNRKRKDTHSVTDTLYFLSGFQCSPATTNEDGSNTNDVDITLCNDLTPTHTLSEMTSFVGRVIDCTRLMIHAGRYDIAEALHKLAQNTISNAQKEETSTSSSSKQESALLDILHRTVNCMWKTTKAAQNRNSNKYFFIVCETKVQIVLAFLSEYLRLLQYYSGKDSLDESSGIALYSDAFDFLEEACTMLFVNNKKEPCDDARSSSNQEHYRETVIRLKDTLHNKVASESPLESTMNAMSEEECPSDVARNSMKQLLADIRLGESFLSENISFAEASSLCEELLKPCFAEVRTFLNREATNNILSSKANPLVRVVILIGHLLMGVVQMLSRNLSTSLTHLDMCGSATVTEIDAGIHQLLQYLLRQVRRSTEPAYTKLLELTLSPLCAFSASLPICVGQYVKTQHRLEVALEVVEDEGICTFGYLSDLFWSSIVQLRVSLPAPQSTHTDDGSRRMHMLWSLPLDIRREHDIISDRISSYGVHLNHISLVGDWNLLREWNNPEALSHDAFHESCCALVTTSLRRMEKKNSDAIVLNLNRIPMKDYPMIEKSKDTISAISAFPQSILVCGSSIVNLQMRECGLQSLPVSFGLHLDRLQNLDLSNNSLSCLPDSIGKLVALCYLDISSNLLKGRIHDQIGMLKNLKKLYASKNQLTDIPISSIVGCRMLELLDVRDNQLRNPLSHELPLKLTKLTSLLVEGNPIIMQR